MKACTLLFHQTFGEKKFDGERLGVFGKGKVGFIGRVPKNKVGWRGIKPSQECIYFSSGMGVGSLWGQFKKIGMPTRTHISMH